MKDLDESSLIAPDSSPSPQMFLAPVKSPGICEVLITLSSIGAFTAFGKIIQKRMDLIKTRKLSVKIGEMVVTMQCQDTSEQNRILKQIFDRKEFSGDGNKITVKISDKPVDIEKTI
jgi:hypothetical protein